MIDRRRFLQAAGAGLVVPVMPACSDVERIRVARVPASGFDDDATAEQVTEGIDLSGKTAVVTGCTSGIGLVERQPSMTTQSRVI